MTGRAPSPVADPKDRAELQRQLALLEEFTRLHQAAEAQREQQRQAVLAAVDRAEASLRSKLDGDPSASPAAIAELEDLQDARRFLLGPRWQSA